jgi:hypothetical protein
MVENFRDGAAEAVRGDAHSDPQRKAKLDAMLGSMDLVKPSAAAMLSTGHSLILASHRSFVRKY